MEDKQQSNSVLGDMAPSKAIVKLAVPATLALLAKAIYNLVDTAYIGMLNSDIALTAVGVTVPLPLIMVSIENVFAAGAAVLAGRQLGAKDTEGAERTVTTVIGLSVIIGILLCVGGIVFIDPLMRAFGLCYMMTITYQTIGASGYGLFLSVIRQGLFYVSFILILPKLLGVTGIYFSQPAADLLTILVCLLSIRPMKKTAAKNMTLGDGKL